MPWWSVKFSPRWFIQIVSSLSRQSSFSGIYNWLLFIKYNYYIDYSDNFFIIVIIVTIIQFNYIVVFITFLLIQLSVNSIYHSYWFNFFHNSKSQQWKKLFFLHSYPFNLYFSYFLFYCLNCLDRLNCRSWYMILYYIIQFCYNTLLSIIITFTL